MSNRITRAMLDRQVEALNRQAGTPETAWTRAEDGTLTANIGNYHLSGGYGGWQLQQVVNINGGVRTITLGFRSKREMAEMIRVYSVGMYDAKA